MRILQIVLAVSLASLSSIAVSQTRDKQTERDRREYSARAVSDYVTEFNEMRLNFVNLRVQDFLSKEMQMTLVGDSETEFKDSTLIITERYHKKIQINQPVRQLAITYVTVPHGDDLIIKSCKMTGHYDYVVDFFVKFWDTTINFEDVKRGEIAISYYITDRVSLTPDLKKGAATILIKKNL